MSSPKERLTVTVDPAVVQAGHDAVAAGHAPSLSSWVNLALVERAAKDRRLRALGDAIAAYEAAHGVISAQEIDEQVRADRRAAIVVRPRVRGGARAPRRRGAA
jgi:hypothetical protein